MAWPSDKAWLMVSVFCRDLSLPLDCTRSYILSQSSFTVHRTFISNPWERWRCLTGQKNAEWSCWCNVWRVTRVLAWCLNITYSNLTTCFLRHFFFFWKRGRNARTSSSLLPCQYVWSSTFHFGMGVWKGMQLNDRYQGKQRYIESLETSIKDNRLCPF